MARVHVLKTWPEPFEAMADGRKRFEYRYDDRGFGLDDVLICLHWDPTPRPYGRSVGHVPDWESCEFHAWRVTYVLRQFGVPVGFVVLGVEPLPETEIARLSEFRMNRRRIDRTPHPKPPPAPAPEAPPATEPAPVAASSGAGSTEPPASGAREDLVADSVTGERFGGES